MRSAVFEQFTAPHAASLTKEAPSDAPTDASSDAPAEPTEANRREHAAGVAEARRREQAQVSDEPSADDLPQRVQQWKRSLLDLSLRNPLLNLPKRGRGLDLHVPPGSLAVLDTMVHEGGQIQVIPQDPESTPDLEPDVLTQALRTDHRIYGTVTEQKYVSAMRDLQREARTMAQETGSNYLYLTLGTLVHTRSNGTEARAPLFLVPVRIEGGTGRKPYFFMADGTELAEPNHCLVEWLRVKHGVEIPELSHPIVDDYGIDIAKTLAAINARLVESHLDYRIDESASLRLLHFSTFQMWRDLADHWGSFLENPVVRHLVERKTAAFDDPAGSDEVPVDEAELHLPIQADGSQLQAIAMAERGRSFVLEGPPGTGKSQTITNLIARAVATGRSVLFVAEKQAALDVVKRRLDQVGLAPFALDLHGRKQSITAIREQLRDAFDQREHGSEATWKAVETGYRSRLAPLAGYPDLVHSRNPAGLSTWSAYEGILAHGDGPTALVPASHLAASAERRRAVEAALRAFPAAARATRLRRAHPWSLSGRRTPDGLHAGAMTQIAAELEAVRQAVVQQPNLVALLRLLPSPTAVGGLLPVARLAASGVLPDRAAMLRVNARWDAGVRRLAAELDRFRQEYAAELATFRPEVFAVSALPAWRAEAQEAVARLFIRNRHLQAVADRLAPYLASGGAVAAEDVEATLARLLAARTQAATIQQQVQDLSVLPLPAGWLPTKPAAATELAQAQHTAALGRQLLDRHPAVWDLFEAGVTDAEIGVLEDLAAGWRAWSGLLASTRPQLLLWTGELHWFDVWQRDGATWLADLRAEKLAPLQRWGDVLTQADVLIAAGLSDYADQLLRAEVDADAAEEVYQRGLTAAALSERMRAGVLDSFEPEQHDNDVEQYEAAARELRATLLDHLPSKLVRDRRAALDDQHGRLAEFIAELRRKRGGRSFRELFADYSDVVLALTPCVLVSPASAANFLAPDAARFDLVVFDEASQIRVAEAIGAMGRGKAVVVVGDSRQMPPSAVMQASAGEETAGDSCPVEDLESILNEAVESGLPQRWLTWHYRSRDESLIAFSNRYYYDGRLSSLPSPGASGTAGIGWRRVDGHFDRGASRTNEVEARAVVEEIAARLRDPATAGDSIGVVTFNIQQRDLILNLLEESSDRLIQKKMSPAEAEPIFVKNLENVQGDERDLILFSLAFSTNPETGQLPLNFGPLSHTGGERRLNVAITRARRQVLLFASFDPADIDLSRTTATGTQHLKAYCEMAAAGVDRQSDRPSGRGTGRDLIRDEVAEAIRARGYEVRTGYGLSDFAVDLAVRAAGSDRWQVAVMLDSPQWSARPTVADRDGAPALLRTVMGWPRVVRFWLPSWINDRAGVLAKLDAAVSRAVAAERIAQSKAKIAARRAAAQAAEKATAQAVEKATAQAAEKAATAERTSATPVPNPRPTGGPVAFVPYEPSVIGTQADIAALATDQRVRKLVRDSLREIIRAEGPVEEQRLAKLVLARFGFAKPRSDRRKAVLALLEPGALRHHEGMGSFAWPSSLDPRRWSGFRTTQSRDDRAFEEIAPEEIANAIRHALASALELTEEDLFRTTLELLGYQRRTEKIDKMLRYGLLEGLASGRVVHGGRGRYRLS
ncbi:DUF4011 domain-containing protein [Planosporangium flavigriseum]|uniref:DNA helicase n=1 Tax=Planosporangium flavigriseum TaxID=373681 RepID=A0A8J3PM26_9ACTN|nr:DUF4011 domain-containing protein [Planosporangium flavigriseum]NJC66073.1 DUF4011 domain-containing protein [Planosporangium flavigriseum]GIG75106.1 DNA helicase [Planosporangium flavigriseum]